MWATDIYSHIYTYNTTLHITEKKVMNYIYKYINKVISNSNLTKIFFFFLYMLSFPAAYYFYNFCIVTYFIIIYYLLYYYY